MESEGEDLLHQVDQLLSMPNQAWLLGAGASKDAGLPLMGLLTSQVVAKSAGEPHQDLLTALVNELPPEAHIEHVLSQLGDYTALAHRSLGGTVNISGTNHTIDQLEAAHKAIVGEIASIVRWGCRQNGNLIEVGKFGAPIVTVDTHLRFVRAIFDKRQAGVAERRKPVQIFTTNYDTLIEDALALGGFACWDGFSGGAVAFRAHVFGKPHPESGYRASIIKLHGSIDWCADDQGNVWRVRDSDGYPAQSSPVLIYPQATKYLATQRDPFAQQFSLFRELLTSQSEKTLAICGYSFGDEHINNEIEGALSGHDNRTTILAFVRENEAMPPTLNKWRNSSWGRRVYVLTEKGLYAGPEGPLYGLEGGERDWWAFGGMTSFLESGGGGVA